MSVFTAYMSDGSAKRSFCMYIKSAENFDTQTREINFNDFPQFPSSARVHNTYHEKDVVNAIWYYVIVARSTTRKHETYR